MLLHLIQTMTTSSKNLDTLVDDIYSVLVTQQEIDDSLVNELSTEIAEVIKSRLSSSSHHRPYLSLSSIGKPKRRLWYDINDPIDDSTSKPHNILKFLYGDIIESVVLWLAKVAGHTVTDRQTEVKLLGIVGHTDSKIDGEVVDAKSASPRSYMKFEKSTLPDDDPFGYLAQVAAYDKKIGGGHPGFLAMNKVTGEICLYRPDPMFDLPDPEAVVSEAKETVALKEPPAEKCYQEEPDGKSGNMRLPKGCCFCPYKFRCWDNLRMFKYSDGIRYLTKVVNEPRVEEIINDKDN